MKNLLERFKYLEKSVGEIIERFRERDLTKGGVINFQDALINLYETEKEGTVKFNLLRDSYKSTIEELKSEL